MVTMTVTTAAATAVAANLAAESLKPERTVPMSRGFKIENFADEGGALQSKLFSADALVHAVSGSVGGNVAMLGVCLWLRAAWARPGQGEGSELLQGAGSICIRNCPFDLSLILALVR
jgi:hypothetical protein